ncbi:MAG: DUF3240 family protein [Gammaproteobacteria bacterium]
MTDELLVLIIPPSLEENVIDWLLANEDVGGFSTTTVFGHSSNPQGLSVAEQVIGRQRRVQIQIHLSEGRAANVISALRRDFSDAGLHYWLWPLAAAGRLEPSSGSQGD